MNKNLINTYIEALDDEHGKQVVEFYKSQGFAVGTCDGSSNKKRGFDNRYYGISKNGYFGLEYIGTIVALEAKIITLEQAKALVEENVYPRIMWVRSSIDSSAVKRVVFAHKQNKYISWNGATSFEEAESVVTTSFWDHAITEEEYEGLNKPKVIELTLEEIAAKFDTAVDLIKIKKTTKI